MPSDKPRVTLRLDNTDMEWLETWAKKEFLTVPQLTRIVVKKAIAEYQKQHPLEAVEDTPEPEPPTAKPAAKTVTKRRPSKS
jgi:hypothetical protein